MKARSNVAPVLEPQRGPIFAPIHVGNDRLHILSSAFRLYIGLSRDGSYLHVISPRQAEVTDLDGNVVHEKGELACSCAGGVFHGDCYRRRQAVVYETGDAIEEAWFGVPIAAETELERMANRG